MSIEELVIELRRTYSASTTSTARLEAAADLIEVMAAEREAFKRWDLYRCRVGAIRATALDGVIAASARVDSVVKRLEAM